MAMSMNARTTASRRTFLKGAAFAGVAAATVAPVAARADEAAEDASQKRPFDVVDTDVVVVGGGLAGMLAARNALRNGCEVVLVDKGPFGHSGASGINWGHSLFNGSYENIEDLDERVTEFLKPRLLGNDGMAPQSVIVNLMKASRDLKLFELVTELGCVVDRSGEDGTAVGSDTLMHGLFPRMLAQHVRRAGVKVMDRTMVLDFIQDEDGAATGVVGIDLVSGNAVVVRAKAVVHAMGGASWANGWCGVGARTNSGLEQTGDGNAILLGHGVPMSGLEFFMPYWYTANPDANKYSNALGFALNDHPERVTNGEGTHFYAESEDWNTYGGLPAYWKIGMKEIYAGRGSEQGGIYMDITDLEVPQNFIRFNRRWREVFANGMGYEIPNPVELLPTPWESQEIPPLTDELQVEGFPGLFHAKHDFGTVFGSTASGHLAGGSAAAYAKTVDAYRPIDLEAVQQILDGAYTALEKDGTLRASDVQHEIQELVYNYLFFGRTADGINTCIAELDRIKAEDIPQMVVPDKSARFNYEWRQAMEVPFMWTYARALAVAALNRDETRYTHHRLDCPNIDNENGFYNVWVSVNDGEFSYEKKPVDDAYISIDELKTLIPNVGIAE